MLYTVDAKIYVHGAKTPYVILWEEYRGIVIGHRDQGFLQSFILIDTTNDTCIVGSLTSLIKDKSESNFHSIVDDIREGVMRLKGDMIVSTKVMVDNIIY